MAVWKKKPFEFKLVGLEQGSAAKPYEIVRTRDLRSGQEWVSCNCMSYLRSKANRGLKNWERTCKHTQRGYAVDDPEIDFPPHTSRTVEIGASVYEGIGMMLAEPLMIGSSGKPRGAIYAKPQMDKLVKFTIPKQERIPFQKPQLPARWQDKYESEVFDKPDWIATVKMDGHRCLVVKQVYGKVEMFSRGGKRMMSVEPAFQDLGLSVGTMIDCELIVGEEICQCDRVNREGGGWDVVAHYRASHPNALRLVVLDVLFVDGKSVMSTPYWQRWQIASSIVAMDITDARVEMVETKPVDISTENWLVFLNNKGAEGVVFWNRNSPYRPGIRSSGDMIKKKWNLETYDVILLGTLPPSEKMDPSHQRLSYGWANSGVMGVAPISGPAEEMEALVGQVIEVEANAVMPSGCLLYPRYVRTRFDLGFANECPVSV